MRNLMPKNRENFEGLFAEHKKSARRLKGMLKKQLLLTIILLYHETK